VRVALQKVEAELDRRRIAQDDETGQDASVTRPRAQERAGRTRPTPPEVARRAAEKDPAFAVNVAALEAVRPVERTIGEFTPEMRADSTLEWLRANKPDLVIFTEPAFGSVKMSPEAQDEYEFRELEALREQLDRQDRAAARDASEPDQQERGARARARQPASWSRWAHPGRLRGRASRARAASPRFGCRSASGCCHVT
jgi:hypothetical protein